MDPVQPLVKIKKPPRVPPVCVSCRLTPQSNPGSRPPVHVAAMFGPTTTLKPGAVADSLPSLTERDTWNVPAELNVFVVVAPLPVEPSPKFQL